MNESYISVSEKEEWLLKFIGRTGFYILDYEDKLGISNFILYSCIRKELICKGNSIFIYTKLSTPYILTNKGADLIKHRYLINPYGFRTNQLEHDFVLANIYLSLTSKERDSWVTETTLAINYPDDKATDGFYISESGERVGVEVLTRNYSEEAIGHKQVFISTKCDKAIIIDADKL